MQKEDWINLPELGEGVTEGELVKWLVSKGDHLKADQVVAEVMTDKAVMEIPSPIEGTVESFYVKEGDTVPVGHKLLKLKSQTDRSQTDRQKSQTDRQSQTDRSQTDKQSQTDKDRVQLDSIDSDSKSSTTGLQTEKEPLKQKPTEQIKTLKAENQAQDVDKTAGLTGDKGTGDNADSIKASPFTRRWAKKLKVDLNQVAKSHNKELITLEDVLNKTCFVQGTGGEAVATSKVDLPQTKPPSATMGFEVPKSVGQDRQALKGIRKKIAQKMQASKAVIPHFTLLESAEVEALEKLKNSVKESLNKTARKPVSFVQGSAGAVVATSKANTKQEQTAEPIKVTYLSFVMKALLQTLKEFPLLNASIDDFSQEIVHKNYYHFGFAVDTPRGLLVPVIKDVDKKSLAELSYEIQTLAEKARQGNIQAEDMKGGTITITNIGSLGGEYATPIINAPESAILGMYRIFTKACWDGSQFVPKKTMNFSLTCDHRLIDGAVSARALNFFIHKIENPLSLFL